MLRQEAPSQTQSPPQNDALGGFSSANLTPSPIRRIQRIELRVYEQSNTLNIWKKTNKSCLLLLLPIRMKCTYTTVIAASLETSTNKKPEPTGYVYTYV